MLPLFLSGCGIQPCLVSIQSKRVIIIILEKAGD
jgi:hypothetical protein